MKLTDAEIKEILDAAMAMKNGTNPSKIKYRESSINATRANYDKELKKLAQLNSQLEYAKSALKDVTYGPGETNNGNLVGSFAEKKINRRINRVANIEAQILQITDGIKPENYIGSRAIKLREYMMNNFVENSRSGYKELSEEAKENLFASEKTTEEPKKETSEPETKEETEEEKLEKRVSELEKEDEDKKAQEELERKIAEANANVDVNTVDSEEAKETVDNGFDEKSQEIDEEDFNDDMKSQMISDNFNNITPISNIKPRKMHEITPAKIAKGVNDDFFDENNQERDVPVVAQERNDKDYMRSAIKSFILLKELDAHIDAEKDPEIIERLHGRAANLYDELVEAKEHLTNEQMQEVIDLLPEEVRKDFFEDESEDEMTTINEVQEKMEESIQEVPEQPVEVETQEEVPAPKENNTGAVEFDTNASIQAIQLIQEELKLIQEKKQKALDEEQQINEKRENAIKALVERKKQLEEKATQELAATKAIEKENAQKNAELNAIFSVIEPSENSINSEKKK